MTQKLEALHLEALCEEVGRGGGKKERMDMSEELEQFYTVFCLSQRIFILHLCVGPVAESPETLRGGNS